MIGNVGEPHFSFPRDVSGVPLEFGYVGEGAHIHQAGGAFRKHRFKFDDTLWGDRPVRGYGLDQEEPSPGSIVQHHIGQLVVFREAYAELRKLRSVHDQVFFRGVAKVEQPRARREAWGELLYDGFLHFVVFAR